MTAAVALVLAAFLACAVEADFLIGDDWRVAAGVAASMLLCALLVHAGENAWWAMPMGVGATLAASLRREGL